MRLPDTSYSWFDTTMNLEECKQMCFKNCSCTAYANSDIRGRGSGCMLWFGDMYIRVAASKLGSSKKKKVRLIIVICVVLIVIILVGSIFCIWRKKLRNKSNFLHTLSFQFMYWHGTVYPFKHVICAAYVGRRKFLA
ncbi:hypothetical protein SLE2022_017210 [Rubroshorea leprosula]